MQDTTTNNKRIAKNTIMLYFRMIFIMGVNLYASRVILQVLGAEDFGTYNVVGGVVTMLSFITASLSGATSRHLTYELGKGQDGDVERLFRCSSTIFYIISIILFVLAETIGLWFVKTQLVIPEGRETAALWVYQFSVIAAIISLLSVTYNALIIAKEHMSAFAYISIYDGLARLGICFLLYLVPFDHLILYAGLITLTQLSVRLVYMVYCKRHFREANDRWLWDKSVSKNIFSYAGWTLSGYMAITGYTQGINILLNIYFGPVVNAARAIATQVQTALAQLYANFQIAVRPQIIKSYAQGDLPYMRSLVLRTGRISFLLATLIIVPFITFTEFILSLWLGNPPEHTVTFVRLTLIACISNSLSHHAIIAIHATGDIKRFQLIEGTCLLMILPVSWFSLKFFHISSEMVILIYVLVEIFTQFVRVWLVYPKIGLKISLFFSDILLPSGITLILCFAIAFCAYNYFYPCNVIALFYESFLLLLIESLIIYMYGLDSSERTMVKSRFEKIKGIIKK